MTKVLLDIGAGGVAFVHAFKMHNAQYNLSFLCGDPRFKNVWNGTCIQGGIQKVCAWYENFNVPDRSIDVVTLNAHSPISFSTHLIAELKRVLKPGGIFFSAHPVGLHPRLPTDDFSLVAVETRHSNMVTELPFQQDRGLWQWSVVIDLPNKNVIIYPASPLIRDRMVQLRLAKLFAYEKRKERVFEPFDAEPTLRMWTKKRI